MKIVICGAGAMGTLFAGRLALGGHDVTMIDVDQARLDAINASGIEETGSCPGHAVVTAGRAEQINCRADLLVMFTKGAHTAQAAAAAEHLLADDGYALTLQNGLGNDEAIAKIFGADRVLIGMTTWPADLVDHGRVDVHGDGSIRLWSMGDKECDALHHVAAALNDAKLSCTLDRRVRAAIWEKVIFNAAMNGTAALTGMTVGQMGDFAPTHQLLTEVMEEGIAVAQAVDMGIDAQSVRDTVAYALAEHRLHKPSMLHDVAAGRMSEVKTILGPLVSEGIRHGLDVSRLETCAALIRGIDKRNELAKKSTL